MLSNANANVVGFREKGKTNKKREKLLYGCRLSGNLSGLWHVQSITKNDDVHPLNFV